MFAGFWIRILELLLLLLLLLPPPENSCAGCRDGNISLVH
jgi:hypothetical protein